MADKTNANGATGATSKGKPAAITKMDAVRKAMAKLGREAGRAAIVDYVKRQFGVEMTADHVSNCKGEIVRQNAAKAKAARANALAGKPNGPAASAVKTPLAKPGAAKAAHGTAQTKPSSAPAKGNGSARTESGISLKDILTVKDLVGRVGPNQLKTLIDAFAG
jgi:hypothetical protein